MSIDAILEKTNLRRLQQESSFLCTEADVEELLNGLVSRKDECVSTKGSASW